MNIMLLFQIQPDDVLPTKICHQCIQIVSLFFTSQRNAKQCDLVLKNYLLLRNFKNVQIAQIEASKSLFTKKICTASAKCTVCKCLYYCFIENKIKVDFHIQLYFFIRLSNVNQCSCSL